MGRKVVLMQDNIPLAELTLEPAGVSIQVLEPKLTPPPFSTKEGKISSAKYTHWLEDRIIPRNRVDIDKQLKLMGLKEYSVSQIVNHSKAALIEDPYWIKTDPTDDFYKDTPRGRLTLRGYKF